MTPEVWYAISMVGFITFVICMVGSNVIDLKKMVNKQTDMIDELIIDIDLLTDHVAELTEEKENGKA